MNDIKESKEVEVASKTTTRNELQQTSFSSNVLGVFSQEQVAELEVFLAKYIADCNNRGSCL